MASKGRVGWERWKGYKNSINGLVWFVMHRSYTCCNIADTKISVRFRKRFAVLLL